MHLLVMAHFGEAQVFIKELNLKPFNKEVFQNLFKSDDGKNFLLVTGEGIHPAILETSKVLALYHMDVKAIVNLGICGGLSTQIQVGDAIVVRTVYSSDSENQMNFHSMSTPTSFAFSKQNAEKVRLCDLVTAGKRITDSEEAKKLSHFAEVVDREFWGVAYAAKNFRVPCYALKIVSDNALDFTHCYQIKDNSFNYSLQLWDFYKRCWQEEQGPSQKKNAKNKDEISLPSDFYQTVGQHRQLEKAYKSFKLNNDGQEIPLSLLDEIRQLEKHPKKRTQLLIQRLNQEVNPFEKKMIKKLDELLSPLIDKEFQIILDKDFEESFFDLKLKIKDSEGFEKIKNKMQEIPYEKIKRILEGEID